MTPQPRRFVRWLLAVAAFGVFGQAWSKSDDGEYDATCIQIAIEEQASDTTIEDIRNQCRKSSGLDSKSALDQRVEAEKRNQYNQFTLQLYRANYILFGSYDFAGINEKPYQGDSSLDGESFEPYEVKFQISLKVPLANDLLGLGDHLFVGYTNRSFWQAYTHNISAPFRETNHEPEVWMSFDMDWDVFGVRNRMIDVGLSHQSNGQSGQLSRSWNRAYLRFIFETENSAFSIKPWVRLPENRGEDDNPDITHYMGNVEFMGVTQYGQSQFSLMLRDNFDFQDNKGAFELGYSYPIHRNLNLYVQWFYGYGESLIDYNYRNNTLSIGFQLGRWL